jgi:hypothetical protein
MFPKLKGSLNAFHFKPPEDIQNNVTTILNFRKIISSVVSSHGREAGMRI